jgi:hypothetical protein
MLMEVPITTLRFTPNEYFVVSSREQAWNEVHIRELEGMEITVIGDLVAEGEILVQLAVYLGIETLVVRQSLRHLPTLALLERRLLDANYESANDNA